MGVVMDAVVTKVVLILEDVEVGVEAVVEVVTEVIDLDIDFDPIIILSV